MKAKDIHNYIELAREEWLKGNVPKLTQPSIDVLKNIMDTAKVISDEYSRKYIWLTAEEDNNRKEFFLVILDLERAIFIKDMLMGDIKKSVEGARTDEVYPLWTRDNKEQKLYDFVALFEWVLNEVNGVIDMLRAGTYEEYILKELPARCRSGVIKLSKYWEYCPEDKARRYSDYDPKVLGDFMKWVDDNKNSPEGYEEMTPSLFYNACHFIYKYNGSDVEGLTPKEAYLRYADGRDMGFSKLPDDYNALKKWIKSYGHRDHADEIEFGRVHMWFGRNSYDKWVFHVASSKDKNNKKNLMRLVLDMAKAGFHMDADYYSEIIMELRGECIVALEPENDYFDYMQAIDAHIHTRGKVKFYPEPFPKELEDEVQWLRPHICQLKE